MEVSKIEEANQPLGAQEVRGKKTEGKSCIYYPETVCKAPESRFKICQNCPRMGQYAQKNTVRAIFNHIKSFAISLLERMDIQFSK